MTSTDKNTTTTLSHVERQLNTLKEKVSLLMPISETSIIFSPNLIPQEIGLRFRVFKHGSLPRSPVLMMPTPHIDTTRVTFGVRIFNPHLRHWVRPFVFIDVVENELSISRRPIDPLFPSVFSVPMTFPSSNDGCYKIVPLLVNVYRCTKTINDGARGMQVDNDYFYLDISDQPDGRIPVANLLKSV